VQTPFPTITLQNWSEVKLEGNGLKNTRNKFIYLSNFWDSGQNYLGVADTTMDLLINILDPIAEKYSYPINVSSVFREEKGLISQTKDVLNRKYGSQQNKLVNLQILHGQFNHSRPRDGFINIWYTGENLRPPLDQEWDIYLSFDSEKIDPRNLYLPFWVTRLGSNVEDAQHTVDLMCNERLGSGFPDKFASLVASNPERIRMGFVNFLEKEAKVDVYGKLGAPIRDKFECISNYKFNLAFENDLYPGYVTEKVFDAWKSRSIPVWRGLDSENYLNENAFLNATNSSFNEILHSMREVSNDVELFNNYIKQPLLQRRYDIYELRKKIETLIDFKMSN
jgi:hypothetical protein